MRPIVIRFLDATAVIAFVLIGRANHDEAASISGALDTLWPFAVGLLVGWLLMPRDQHTVVAGLRVWLSTVVIGMALRAASGQGTAASFVVVATIFLGVTLIGWRLVANRRVRQTR